MAHPNGKEQQKAYARLCDTLPPSLALFVVCAYCDVPYKADVEAESWSEYLGALGREDAFADGETDYNAAELAGMDKHERWAVVWGSGYSENECEQLDDLFRTMTAQLDANGGLIDKMQEDAARTCARMALQRNRLIRSNNKDDIAMAKNLDEMIRKNLADCNMRKADVLPSQKQRLDGFVDALRKKCGLDAEMTQEDVLQVFFNWCRRKKYPMTTDAADHALLSILRTMAKNDDLPEPTDLSPDMRFGGFSGEFADEPNEQERETYEYLHLVREAMGSDGED